MQLKHANVLKSRCSEDRVRLSGEVAYDDRAIRPELYWFDVPEKYAEYLSTSGNPWLACLLPLAATLGEPLRISLPVDRVLFENVQELMRIWKYWYPHLHVVPMEAEAVDIEQHELPTRTAAFFSGGIDSFFTILHHTAGFVPGVQHNIDDLL